jgi:RNA polymerase sigma-70 factor (ECF subfamily)
MPPPATLRRTLTIDSDLVDRLEPYRAYLMLLARVQVGRRLRGKADPDDLVQETFLAAVAGAARFRGAGEAELAAWLRRILLSRVLKLVERYCGCAARDVRRELAQLLDASADSLHNLPSLLPTDQSTPSRAAQRRERVVIVADTLASLAADHREVLTLRHLEGLSFPEVAERMGRSVGAVTMLWTRAVRQFRHALSDEP